MKGFYIEITNNLLDPKHYKAMGRSVWVYMWCIDRMTSVTEDGEGWVLGGKPIKASEITEELGVGVRMVRKHIEKLQKAGYINAKRTPYGHQISVNKAKKRFAQKTEQKVRSEEREQKVPAEGTKSSVQREQKVPYKEDKTVRQDSRQGESEDSPEQPFDDVVFEPDEEVTPTRELRKKQKPKSYDKEIKQVYKLFKDPWPENWRMNKSQRQAAENLYRERGIQQVKKALEFYRDNKDHEYCPKIRTPYDLDSKWSQLFDFKNSL